MKKYLIYAVMVIFVGVSFVYADKAVEPEEPISNIPVEDPALMNWGDPVLTVVPDAVLPDTVVPDLEIAPTAEEDDADETADAEDTDVDNTEPKEADAEDLLDKGEDTKSGETGVEEPDAGAWGADPDIEQ